MIKVEWDFKNIQIEILILEAIYSSSKSMGISQQWYSLKIQSFLEFPNPWKRNTSEI